ncbi:hypothetical protein Tco_0301315, partial [Tanacetum coccineum]
YVPIPLRVFSANQSRFFPFVTDGCLQEVAISSVPKRHNDDNARPQQEGAQVRRMTGSGRWKGKIEEMH